MKVVTVIVTLLTGLGDTRHIQVYVNNFNFVVVGTNNERSV